MTTTLDDPSANEFEEPTERYAVPYCDDGGEDVHAMVYTCLTRERGGFKVVRTYERTAEGLLADSRYIGLVVADDYESVVAALGEPRRPVAVPVSVAREIGFQDHEFAPDDYHPSLGTPGPTVLVEA